MPKRVAPLTAAAVKAAKPGVITDGQGLVIVTKATGASSFVLRYTFAGKRRDMGLGAARGPAAITLAEARARAADARKLIAQGLDPIATRAGAASALVAEREAAEAKAAGITFTAAAEAYIAAHEAGWRNEKHRAQWGMTLRVYAAPHLGELPVATIETRHVVDALRPIWTAKPETASRLRGRIEMVLDHATVQGWREGPNPARWRPARSCPWWWCRSDRAWGA